MKKISLIVFFLMLVFGVETALGQSVLPKLLFEKKRDGWFTFDDNTSIYSEMKGKEGERLVQYVNEGLGKTFRKGNKKQTKNIIRLVLNKDIDKISDNWAYLVGYQIDCTENGIFVLAADGEGFFHAFQTLFQMVENSRVQCCYILDNPRFPYRGMMIDCSRHFWSKDFIKKQIDAMARFKLNRLHLHLTDAAGWRVETGRYPRLTEQTAFRTESDWDKWWIGKDRRYLPTGTSGAYGGYYTKDDLREIVDYAAQRYITVIPEIEMPGHSEEVLFAYPELSCSGEPYRNGELCIGNEKTFDFLENVLSEVIDIFPSEYIHIGGDEAAHEAWAKCPKCQARMKAEGLSTTAELQGYLITRIERFLNSRGRQIIGWDEILEGKLAPNATVMSWRGTSGGLKAAQMQHNVIMSPGGYCYLDSYQDAPETQPRAFGGITPLAKTYGYDPVPDELKGTEAERYITGIQGNLWTEMIETPAHVEYMLYPRILAIAERGWSTYCDDYGDFRSRALTALEWMKQQGYNVFDLEKEVGERPEASQLVSHVAVGKPVTYNAPYADAYKANLDNTLTDGKRGGWAYGDGRWQGFIGEGRLDVTIDMEAETALHDISVSFMQFAGPEIFAPQTFTVLVSNDGQTFTELYREEKNVGRSPDYFIRHCRWSGNARARYVRIKATAGQFGGWIFTDEIVVN